ncbi:MAG: hypothetical protein ACOZNI_21890 [Myxococcota bacterium]
MFLGLALCLGVARAESPTTRDALDRLEEVLELRVDDGRLRPEEVLPAVLVSAQPRDDAARGWYVTRVVEILERSLGAGGLRLCEACTAPRAVVEDGRMVYQAGPVGLEELARLDDASRGGAEAARTAIWVDEYLGGVSIRVVDLRTARVIFAQNVDPSLIEHKNTRRMYTLAAEQERRARGDGLTQAFVDAALYPGQHVSLDWTDQWGPTNRQFSGLTLSILDPVLGLGAVHYYCIGFLDILVGAQVVVSLPTAIVRGLGQEGEVLDPMLTGVAVARVPFGRSNFGGVVTASTNGSVGVGISLMNISLLPVIP